MTEARTWAHLPAALVVPAIALAIAAGAPAEEPPPMPTPLHVQSLSFDAQPWEYSSRGKFLLVKDPRGLHQVFHPWETSEDGDFGALTTRVTVPADWQGPLFLNLYANDTYVSEGWEQTRESWTHTYAACHNLVGHRFKQALINDQVVWDQDVADAESFGYFGLDISPHVKPGETFTLTLRVLEKTNPATKLPGDEFRLGIWSWDGLKDPEAARGKLFTRVFWGDVALSDGAPVAWDSNPARPPIVLRPVKLAAAKATERAEGAFVLSCPEGLPEDGYPVTWGVPFGEGRLFDKSHVRLLDAAGNALPLQGQVLHTWPDGSIHWLLLDFQAVAANANKPITLQYGAQVAPTAVAPGLTVTETEQGVTVSTGALTFSANRGGAALAEGFTLAGEGQPLCQKLTGHVKTRDGWVETTFAPVSDQVRVEASGPERVTVLCTGELRAAGQAFGRFTCRLHAYRGRPYLRVLFRVFNDTAPPAQLVEEMVVGLQTSLAAGQARLGDQTLPTGPQEVQRLLVRQQKADAYEVFNGSDARLATGQQWTGPISLEDDTHGVTGEVRHFAQQYPKRMWAGQGGQMVFDLFARTIEYEQYVMTRGEAKRHELLLYFHPGSGEQPKVQAAMKAFEAPPALVSPEWYADQQAFGRGAALTTEQFPRLHKWMLGNYTPGLACGVPLGLRNWPDSYSDSIYNAYRGTWQNMYQEQDYGAYILALLGGSRPWLDFIQAYQTHFMDLDICHYHPDPAWVGSSYGISPYHTGHQPYSLNAPLAGLFVAHYLTGDPDAREAAIGIADWVCATNQGVGAGSGRAVGWPLRSLMIAFENTRDPKHLEAGRKLAESALAVLDARRGFFSETPATWQYRGGTPGMNAILAAGLMRYWRLTGDEAVGKACANMAYNMAYSWMSPTEPGLLLGSDPLQQVYITGYAMQDILPLWWGYELTGDKAFLEKGAQMMEASILDEKHKGSAFGVSRYWEMQDIMYYYGMWLRERGGTG